MNLYRIMDFLASLFGLLVLSPIIIVLLIAGYFDTGHPLFVQIRVGRHQTSFSLLKFRSMRLDTESVATHLVDDAAITPFGRFLRRTKLDELPQLINVLKGEMSLVGPRPCLPNQRDLIDARAELNVYSVLPGITGLAQINGIDMSNPKRLAEWDAKMIAEYSLKNYFVYLIQTMLGKGYGDRTRT